MTYIDGHETQVNAYLDTAAGEHLALDIARQVHSDDEAWGDYLCGLSSYAPAVERILDRLYEKGAK